MAITFNIIDWKAWVPLQDNTQPDVSVIPAMLRRRLSPLARMAMSVIIPLAEKHGAMPLVYVSRHGDLHRTLELLKDITKGELLSPTAFSLSVHNATAGLFSIHSGTTKNITAISCGTEELVPALLEAVGQCTAEDPKVLCVFCDEPPPTIYQEQAAHPDSPYAVAMIVGQGEDWQALSSPSENAAKPPFTSQSLAFVSLLENETTQLTAQLTTQLVVTNNGTDWTLSRLSR